MVLNLGIEKSILFFPTLLDQKITGPEEVKNIIAAIKKLGITKKHVAIITKVMSISRFSI
jgi:hypothetical protein